VGSIQYNWLSRMTALLLKTVARKIGH